jgi:hypothetical protein
MAFYSVITNGNSYINTELATHLYKKGKTSFLFDVIGGKIASQNMFGMTLIPLDSKVSKRYKDMLSCIEVQDVDKRIKEDLVDARDGVRKIIIDKDVELFTVANNTLVRFTDVVYPSKYNRREVIATIKICAVLFVVLDKEVNGKELSDSIVFTLGAR